MDFILYCRKRKRSLEESDKGTAGRSFHGETELTVRIGSKKEIDDDGYRWRKYGQKIMKGCLYPRYTVQLSLHSLHVQVCLYIFLYNMDDMMHM